MISILEKFDKCVKENEDKLLLITNDKNYTYKEFSIMIDKAAGKISKTGITQGKVSIVIEEYDYFYAALFAVWKLGLVAVPLNTSLTADELDILINNSDSALIIHTTKEIPERDGIGKIRMDLDLSDNTDVEYNYLSMDDTAVMMFTSGTTGIPKGVVQTLYAQSQNAQWTAEALGLDSDDRVYINTPPYFTSGLCHFTTMINVSGSLVGKKGFSFGSGLLKDMEDYEATGFGGAPAHLIRVVETLGEVYENEKLKFWMSSGDHLPKNAIEKTRKMMPNVQVINVYGLTEVAGRLCVLKPEFAIEKHGSVGVPIGDMKVTITDAAGTVLPAGKLGEINVDGSLLFLEYYKRPEVTAKAKGEYGFKTGDMGLMDEDGFVFIEGRRDDIFKRGGEKVSTNKIKQKMLELGIFKDVAVTAKDDEMMGKVPVAVVVLKDGEKFSRIKIIKALRQIIVDTHIPANIIQVDEIPRTGSGKAIKNKLNDIVNRRGR